VAPVTKPSVDSREVYLPEGRWIHYWTDEVYKGGEVIEIDTPQCRLEGMPLFVRAGAIVPSQPVVQHTAENLPEELTLDVYPGGDSKFVFYESQQIASEFTCQKTGEAVELRVENSAPIDREYNIRVHLKDEVTVVKMGDKRLHRDHFTLNDHGVMCFKLYLESTGMKTVEIN
jgi:alpha-glucosidase (family GH31 glycosyl hydrolase)